RTGRPPGPHLPDQERAGGGGAHGENPVAPGPLPHLPRLRNHLPLGGELPPFAGYRSRGGGGQGPPAPGAAPAAGCPAGGDAAPRPVRASAADRATRPTPAAGPVAGQDPATAGRGRSAPGEPSPPAGGDAGGLREIGRASWR